MCGLKSTFVSRNNKLGSVGDKDWIYCESARHKIGGIRLVRRLTSNHTQMTGVERQTSATQNIAADYGYQTSKVSLSLASPSFSIQISNFDVKILLPKNKNKKKTRAYTFTKQEAQTHGQKHPQCHPQRPRIHPGLQAIPGAAGYGAQVGLDDDAQADGGAGCTGAGPQRESPVLFVSPCFDRAIVHCSGAYIVYGSGVISYGGAHAK